MASTTALTYAAYRCGKKLFPYFAPYVPYVLVGVALVATAGVIIESIQEKKEDNSTPRAVN